MFGFILPRSETMYIIYYKAIVAYKRDTPHSFSVNQI